MAEVYAGELNASIGAEITWESGGRSTNVIMLLIERVNADIAGFRRVLGVDVAGPDVTFPNFGGG